MSDRKVKISVETTADTKGISDAEQGLDKLGKTADDTGRLNKGAADNTQKLGQATGRAAEMVGSLSGAMGQTGPAAAQMGAGLRVLKALVERSSAGFMGLATVLAGTAVSAYVAYTHKVEESKKKLAEFAAQIEANKRAQDAAGVDKLAGQYDVLRAAIDDSTAAQNRLNQAQAAADSAEKAARMADITLREKQAMAGLKQGDSVGTARVSAQFTSERRDLEAEYTLRDAERTAQAKAQALSDAEAKLRITEQMDIPRAAEEMQKFEDQIRKVNEELADLYGQGAPMKRVVDESNIAAGLAGAPAYKMVVDTEEQAKRAAALRGKIAETDKDGKPTGEGLEPAYRVAAEALAAAIDRQAKEAVEVQARRIEAEAAVKVYDTTREMTPRINAADSALEQRDIKRQQEEANLALFRGRVGKIRSAAEANAMSRQTQADQFDAGKYSSQNRATRSDAQRIDKQLDKDAADAKRLLAEAKALEEKIKAMNPDALARSIKSLTQQMNRLDQALKNLPNN